MVLLAAAVIIGMRPVLTDRCTTNVTLKIPIGPISHHIGHYDSQVSEPYMSLGSSERLISGPSLGFGPPAYVLRQIALDCHHHASPVYMWKGCNSYNQNQRSINKRESGRYGLELLLLYYSFSILYPISCSIVGDKCEPLPGNRSAKSHRELIHTSSGIFAYPPVPRPQLSSSVSILVLLHRNCISTVSKIDRGEFALYIIINTKIHR